MGLGIALKAFSAALFDKQKSASIGQLLDGNSSAAVTTAIAETKAAEPTVPVPVRDHAITLLATLQREARLVDLIHEDLSQYSDAQVGAAARPCLQQCVGVLKRLLNVQPLVVADEGASVEIEQGGSPMRYQWIGEGTAESGKLVHHGWQANDVELPEWTGATKDANIIAPAQVQAI